MRTTILVATSLLAAGCGGEIQQAAADSGGDTGSSDTTSQPDVLTCEPLPAPSYWSDECPTTYGGIDCSKAALGIRPLTCSTLDGYRLLGIDTFIDCLYDR